MLFVQRTKSGKTIKREIKKNGRAIILYLIIAPVIGVKPIIIKVTIDLLNAK